MKPEHEDWFVVIGITAVLVVCALIVALAITAAIDDVVVQGPLIADCPEDSLLRGTGQFEDGQWTSYVCGPAVDDRVITVQPGAQFRIVFPGGREDR